jgi:hypothetical protein
MKNHTHKKTPKFLLVLFSLIISNCFVGQNVTVSGALSGNGSYVDLKSAFTAINGAAQTGANISVLIVGNTTETVSAVLNSGAWASLSISPSGGVSRTITGSLASPIIDLNGASNISINGLNTGGNSLIISNTDVGSLTTSTIRLMNGASNNTITNCFVYGSSTSVSLGTIFCYTSTASAGNSNNIFSNCDIGAAGGNMPANGIYSAGTSTALNQFNTVQNCRIYDFFRPNIATTGIFVSTNSSNWTITGNRLYQTTACTYTTANTHKAISVASGTAYTVSNNIIGYASSAGTGTLTMNGAVASRFVAIELTVATSSASSVQGNTITAINFTTTSATGTGFGILCGINILGGAANVGTTAGNLIGGTSGTDLIACSTSGSSGGIVGINAGTTGSITVQNNYIGGCSTTATAAATACSFIGINVSAGPAALSILTNTIGNPSTDNLKAGTFTLTTGSSIFSGINITSTATGTTTVNGNLVRNGASYGSGTGGSCRGIYTTVGNCNVFTNNTVTNLTTNNGNTSEGTGQIGTLGIGVTAGTSNVIANNYISTIANTNTLTTSVSMAGISTAASTSPRLSNNQIYDLWNTGVSTTTTAPSKCYGIFIRGATTSVTVNNNMISLGTGQSYNTSFTGICFDGGGGNPGILQIYYNTINITGVVTSGSQSTFGFYRGGFAGFGTACPVDVRNNIITNTRSGGTGSHYAIVNNYGFTASNTGWGVNASNYNVLNTGNSATVGWWGADQTFTNWKSTSAGDGASYSGVTVNYANSANNLHLNFGLTPTSIESNGIAIGGFATDLDGQSRPGPAGSVNGAGFAPDLGADEIDGVFLDASAPTIVHTALPGLCTLSQADRIFTASISDFSGVSIGTTAPRVYYRKNANAYISSPGVLASGTATNGVWSFTISPPNMGGLVASDVVSYYIIAQDQSPGANISSLPAAGLVASNVNSVTTPPTNAYNFLAAGMSGVYTVGSGGNYTSLTSAASAYNTGCLNGAVTFSLINTTYSSAETFPIIFLNNSTASATNSLLIIPAAGTSVAITPTNTAINSVFKFLDARYITINGLNTGGSALTISNSNVSSASANIWLASSNGSNPGSRFIAVKNCQLNGGYTSGSNGVIASVDGSVPSATPGQDNDNFTFTGNTLLRFYNGILAVGSASIPAGGIDNWVISNNTFGPLVNGVDAFGGSGVIMAGAANFSITNNLIQSIYTTVSGIYGLNINQTVSGFVISQNTLTNLYSNAASSGVNSIAGIYLGSGVANGTITTNVLASISSTTSGGYGVRGITVNTGLTSSNILLRNNFITDIWNVTDATVSLYMPCGIAIEGSSGGVSVENNSINLYGSHTGYSTGATYAACLYVGSSPGGLIIRNNIFSNTFDNSSSTTDVSLGIYSAVTAGVFSTIDYNCYYAGGTGNTPAAGYLGSNLTTLANMQSGFGQNLHSVLTQPLFTSNTDLHLVASTNAALDNLGVVISGITTDIDLQTRSLSTPDMGADEFTSSATCASASAGSITAVSYSACSSVNGVVLSSAGYGAANGTTYQWKISSAAGGPYTNVATGTGAQAPSYNLLLPSNGTYYFIFTSACSTFTSASTNEATVTVVSPPTTSISSTSSLVCQGSSATLTASGATSYLWSTGATTSSITISPTAATPYTVTGSSAVCSVPFTINILYSANPTVNVVSSSPTVCSNVSATLTASGATTYSWSNGSTSAVITPTQASGTNYTLTGYNSSGCVSAPVTSSVSVNPSPTINISGSSGICTGQTATLNVSGTGASSYSWSTGSTSTSIVDAPTTNTTYIVTGSSSLGCVSTLTQAVTVAASLSISISGPSGVCSGKTATLTSSGGVTYLWNNGATTNTLVISPTTSTTYSVVGSSGTCSNSAALTVTINPVPAVTISGVTTICAGITTTLTAGGASSYTWNTGPNTSTIAVAPSTNTSYTVTGTSSLGCTSSSIVTVVSNTIPVLSVAQTATAVCLNSSATFTASGANTFTWVTTGNPTTSTLTVTPLVNTTYTVNGTNAAGCVGSKTVAVISNTFPVVTIAPSSATVCSLSQVGFVSSGANTYTWNNNSSLTGATVSFTPSVNTTYTVTGTSPQGCNTTTTVAVTTNSLPVIIIAPPSVTVCAQSFTNFTATGAVTYTWDANTVGSSVSLYNPGNITHTVTGTNAAGCASSATVGVTTNPLPALVATPSFTTVCENAATNFSVTGASTYTWNGNNNTTGPNITLTPSATIAYTVTGTDILGCSSTILIPVITNSLPVLSITPSNATVCSISDITLTANGAGSYSWSAGVTSGGSTVVVTPTVNSTYTVFGASSTNGCIGSTTVAVATNSLPVITISPSSPSVCIGSVVTLTASGSANTYTWNNSSAGNTFGANPLSNTTYTVKGKNSVGCTSTQTVSIVVNALPVIAVTPASPTICVKETVQLTASGATIYAWSTSTVTSNVFNASPYVSFTYIITGTDPNGCTNTGSVTVTVDKCLGINEIGNLNNLISVYPNPSSGLITTKFDFEGKKEITIVNSVGAVISNRTTESTSENFDFSDLAKGIYFVKISTKNTANNYKIIIQ